MNKDAIIAVVTNAKRSHKTWVENAHSLIDGIPLDKEKVPVNSTSCKFGEWYYGDGQKLKRIPGFKEIEEQHDALHHTYREIFVLLFGEEESSSFFRKLFGISQRSSAKKLNIAKEKVGKLDKQSITIMKMLDDFGRTISSMTEEQINRY
ncbi:MAG TPA: CZB domain-containing protein [Candidatus Competibacteraceae bacterium]|nr:MAG: hypothetical protein EKK71_08885 [Candidatus Competibacteraceae bacterium]HOB62502.1 CZB domain-containing protein [Candidatus Competibacteraceae bacterium]HQA25048.1 CZB domain-containing protein [Candidatus Competibacteraceae bacterium]HQD56592.1 CZB domain-containing protein [Candidatus Competibacteraceae bacterium]